jgi:hypothetical protein
VAVIFSGGHLFGVHAFSLVAIELIDSCFVSHTH